MESTIKNLTLEIINKKSMEDKITEIKKTPFESYKSSHLYGKEWKRKKYKRK